MRLGLIPPVGSGSAQRNMEELPHCSGLAIAAPCAWLFVSFCSRGFVPGSCSNHILSLESLRISAVRPARSDELQKPDCGPQSGPASLY